MALVAFSEITVSLEQAKQHFFICCEAAWTPRTSKTSSTAVGSPPLYIGLDGELETIKEFAAKQLKHVGLLRPVKTANV